MRFLEYQQREHLYLRHKGFFGDFRGGGLLRTIELPNGALMHPSASVRVLFCRLQKMETGCKGSCVKIQMENRGFCIVSDTCLLCHQACCQHVVKKEAGKG